MGSDGPERVRRESVDERLDRRGGRLALAEVLPIVVEVATILARAHREGLWHGRLSLRAIILVSSPGETQRLELIGFERSEKAKTEALPATVRLEGPSQPIWYFAPEQLTEAASSDPKSDVFSLGAVTYHLIAGVPPYQASSANEHLAALRGSSPLLLRQREPEVPVEIEELIGWMLAKRSSERPSMEQVRDRLRGVHKHLFGSDAPAEPPAPNVPEAADSVATPIRSSTPTVQLPSESTPSPRSQPPADGALGFDGRVAIFAAIATAFALIGVAYLWHTYDEAPVTPADLRLVIPAPADLPTLHDLAPRQDLMAARDLRPPAENLHKPEDLQPPPDLTTPHRPPSCRPVSPTDSCIDQNLPATLRRHIIASLLSVGIRLCPNERLVWNRFSTHMVLDRLHDGAIRRVSEFQERQFSQALVGRLAGEQLPAEIVVSCTPSK